MKALKRIHAASAAADHEVDELARLRRLDSENDRLRELVQYCAEHSAHGDCGYDQMKAEQKALYDAVIGRRAPATALRIAGVAAPEQDSPWRSCEFCGCRTNATERVCCRRGRDTDRRNWNPPVANPPGASPSGANPPVANPPGA
jgi:hypothetical protein